MTISKLIIKRATLSFTIILIHRKSTPVRTSCTYLYITNKFTLKFTNYDIELMAENHLNQLNEILVHKQADNKILYFSFGN